jgi:hypothetical protein
LRDNLDENGASMGLSVARIILSVNY